MARSTASRPLLWIVIGLILMTCAGIAVSHGQAAYTPLTVDQAKAYMAKDPDAAVQDIIKLDWIEHVAPTVAIPASVLAIHGRDASLAWQAPLIVTVPPLPGSMMVMPSYSITLKDTTYKDVVPGVDRNGYITVGLVGVALGVGAMLLLHR